MDMSDTPIPDILKAFIEPVEKKLRRLCKKEYPQAMIHSGAWTNTKLTTAYVSLFPSSSPSDDSIDFIMQATLLEASVELRVDISRSSGELIVEILNETINFTTEVELISKISDESRRASKVLLQKVSDLYYKGVYGNQ